MINYNSNIPNYCCINRSSLQVNGMGTIKTDPDRAVVTLGVVTENESLEAAQAENAAKSSSVISKLQELGIPSRYITTTVYNIEPQYDYVEGKQIFRGYRVSNIIAVILNDPNNAGRIIDEATSSGANRVDNVVFKVSDPSRYYYNALRLAVKDAAAKAKTLSETLGISINEIPYKVTEISSSNVVEDISMVKFQAASTPIMRGQTEITARIEAFFYY